MAIFNQGLETDVCGLFQIQARGGNTMNEKFELSFFVKVSLKTKGMVYRSYVRSAMLHGSDTWFLRENEMTILRRTE